MKRTVLCIFSLLLILLVFCTMISPKAAQEMETLVVAKRTESKMNTSIGDMSLRWEHGQDMIYTLTEGTGWETGLRIAEMPRRAYTWYDGAATIGPGVEYLYIYSASRPPVAGGTVRSVKVKYGNDEYLIWHPETLGDFDKLPNSITVIARGENVAHVRSRNAANPYFEHNMWFTFKDMVGKEVRVYSLRDVESFAKALPWAVAIFSALLCSILLWAGTFLLTRKGSNKWIWLGNTGLTAALLGAIPLLCDQFNLPASLMPPTSILDISHYAGELQRVITAMKTIGNSAVRSWYSQAATLSALVAAVSILLTVGVVLAERYFCSRIKE